MKKLSAREERFVIEFIKDQKPKAAAIRAGYTGKNCDVQAARLLARESVQAAIKAKMVKIEAKNEITAERVLNGLLRIAEADLRKAYDKNGKLLPMWQMPDDVALAMASLDTDELRDQGVIIGQSKKVKMWDKVRAYELLGKYMALFTDRLAHSYDEDAERRLREARERATPKE